MVSSRWYPNSNNTISSPCVSSVTNAKWLPDSQELEITVVGPSNDLPAETLGSLTFNFGAIWKTLERFIKDNGIDINVFKVKSQSNNMGNDIADGLCKTAHLNESDNNKSKVNIKNDYMWEYLVFWRYTNQLKYIADWLALNVNRSYRVNITDVEIDWKASINIIMKEFQSDVYSLNNDFTAYNLKNFTDIYNVKSKKSGTL
ncbi:hypothetical protein C1646_750557 [Rhizophagus diaphanus]|nr:hypothetical protein C1646_750557 [Rhizophagus diaphanus] [Rhizophagus sp. MUCL 43196]